MIPTATYPPKFLRSANGGYRYFFNGQEADNKVLGEGSLAGYEFRQYDTRLGLWWGVDRKSAKYPSLSPYQFCAGNPIVSKDVDGSDYVVVIDNSGDNKTITVQMNIYAASRQAFNKLKPAVKEINSITKKVTIDGVEYTLSFVITPVKADPKVYEDYQKDQTRKANMIYNAHYQAEADGYCGNAFMGTWERNNEERQENGKTYIKAGYTANGKIASMNAYKGVYMLDNDGFDVEDKAKVRIEYLNNSEPIQSYSNIEVK